MTLALAILLILIALVGGACITTIGPGGIFVTIALFLLLPLDPGVVAGTASVTFIGTGLLGSYAYLRSGHLSAPGVPRAALLLSVASVIGAFAGAWVNTLLDAAIFGRLLGLFVFCTGVLIALRERRLLGQAAGAERDLATPSSGLWMIAVGVAVGLPGGLLGVGGPVLAVPILVVLNVPMLLAVALAQVQSIFIAAFATLGYGIQGAIDPLLAVLVGLPLLIGTFVGWWVALRIRPERLKLALAFALLAVGVYLLTGAGAR